MRRVKETVTLQRPLTATKPERRARVRAAARELATEGGYDAVTIREVADRAGVARATVYRYFSSKDHLLAEAIVQWGYEIIADLKRDRREALTPAERIGAVFAGAVERGMREPRLVETALAVALSRDPNASRPGVWSLIDGYVDVAIGDAAFEDRETLVQVLGYVLFSTLVNLVSGRTELREATAVLESAARLLAERS
jgi:AcrR family transcriptional regulator